MLVVWSEWRNEWEGRGKRLMEWLMGGWWMDGSGWDGDVWEGDGFVGWGIRDFVIVLFLVSSVFESWVF